MAEDPRPLNSLNSSRGKRIVVYLSDGSSFAGTLKAFDLNINIVLDAAEENSGGFMQKKIGPLFLRGDKVKAIYLAN